MRVVFNTKYPEAAASTFYRHALSGIKQLSFSRRDSYHDIDVALFMAFPNDIKDLIEARKMNPQLKIGVIDPRDSSIGKYISFIDFIIVDSIEMKDFFGQFQRPMFTYYEYPDVSITSKQHYKQDTTVIGYHGNKVHLVGMYFHITKALKLLGEKYRIEFRAMYNIDKLGKWNVGVPRNIPVKHIQWSHNNYYTELAEVDIGIVPNLIPISNLKKAKKSLTVSKNFFLDSEDDYLIRFKVPSNPGRIIVFSKLGIPVVADMFPSAMQVIQDGHNGYLAYSCGGWYNALEKLIVNPDLRTQFASNMRSIIEPLVDYKIQNNKFIAFLDQIVHSQRTERKTIVNTNSKNASLRFLFMKENINRLISRSYAKLKKLVKNNDK